jgi:hypothetical protein
VVGAGGEVVADFTAAPWARRFAVPTASNFSQTTVAALMDALDKQPPAVPHFAHVRADVGGDDHATWTMEPRAYAGTVGTTTLAFVGPVVFFNVTMRGADAVAFAASAGGTCTRLYGLAVQWGSEGTILGGLWDVCYAPTTTAVCVTIFTFASNAPSPYSTVHLRVAPSTLPIRFSPVAAHALGIHRKFDRCMELSTRGPVRNRNRLTTPPLPSALTFMLCRSTSEDHVAASTREELPLQHAVGGGRVSVTTSLAGVATRGTNSWNFEVKASPGHAWVDASGWLSVKREATLAERQVAAREEQGQALLRTMQQDVRARMNNRRFGAVDDCEP